MHCAGSYFKMCVEVFFKWFEAYSENWKCTLVCTYLHVAKLHVVKSQFKRKPQTVKVTIQEVFMVTRKCTCTTHYYCNLQICILESVVKNAQ